MSRPVKYTPGDLVFAKVKGYPPWPARVTSCKSSRYKVFFYGTYETATLKKDDIWPYNQENVEKFAPRNIKRKGYPEGLDQIENNPEIAPVDGDVLDCDIVNAMDTSNDTSVMDNTDTSLVTETPKQKQSATPAVTAKPKASTVSSPKVTPVAAPKSTPVAAPKSTPVAASKTTLVTVPKATPVTAPKTKTLPISSTTPAMDIQSNAKGNKRKANDSLNATPAKRPSIEDSPAEQEKTSRSGRVIKPKKFDDDVIASPRAVSESGGEGDGPVTASPPVSKIKKLIEPKISTEVEPNVKKENVSVKKVEGIGEDVDNFTKVKSPKIAVVAPQKSENNGDTPKVPRKMWVQVKTTNDLIEINLDKEKPESFESEEARVHWEMATARNAIKFKNKVESGEFIPPEIRKSLEEKAKLSPEEREILKRGKQLENRKNKLRWLKIEQRMVDLDIKIKTALHMERPAPQTCIEALDELNILAVAPLMLKKQPDIVTTIRRLRKYVGPQEYLNWPDKESRDNMNKQIEIITQKADRIYNKFKSTFAFQEGDRSFWEDFDKQVQEFKRRTDGMEESKILALIRDPTKGISITNPLSDDEN